MKTKLQDFYEENMSDWNILNSSLHKCKQAYPESIFYDYCKEYLPEALRQFVVESSIEI